MTNSLLILEKAQVSHHLSRRLPYYLTPDEVHRLTDAAENERDRLFLRLLWETGLRVSEATHVRLGDVGRDRIRVLGKGRVERVVFVQDCLVTSILFYAQENAMERNDFLFPSRKGSCITKQRADQIIKKTAANAKLERRVHAHLFRHGYAINFGRPSGTVGAPRHQHNEDLPASIRRRR